MRELRSRPHGETARGLAFGLLQVAPQPTTNHADEAAPRRDRRSDHRLTPRLSRRLRRPARHQGPARGRPTGEREDRGDTHAGPGTTRDLSTPVPGHHEGRPERELSPRPREPTLRPGGPGSRVDERYHLHDHRHRRGLPVLHPRRTLGAGPRLGTREPYARRARHRGATRRGSHTRLRLRRHDVPHGLCRGIC